MSIAQRVALLQKLRLEATWKALAAKNAPMVLTMLKEHLGEAERILPSSVLYERVERDLRALRAEGQDWSNTAQIYIADWLNDGLLERRLRSNGSEEEYELTPPAWQAIRFVESLTQERTVATESRLSTVIQQLSLLAEQTDKDPESRSRSLKIEREKIDQQIKELREGKVETLSEDRAIERARDVIALADELANDFRKVRSSFEKLNQSLRESILESDGSRGEILEKLFADVDVISESESGRTFRAFWRLLTDPEQSAQLEHALDQILDRDFSEKLSRKERLFLLRLTNLLLEQGKDVHEVLQHFARSLKQFVQSKEFLEQKRLNQLIKRAQLSARKLKDQVGPHTKLGNDLMLSSSAINSISRATLHDPSLDLPAAKMSDAEPQDISVEEVSDLIAHSEINFKALETSIETLLEERGQISISDLLHEFPAEQGLGTVIGYIALGVKFGIVSVGHQLVTWKSKGGGERSARIPRIYFLKEQVRDNA